MLRCGSKKQEFTQSLGGAGLVRFFESGELVDPSVSKTMKLDDFSSRQFINWIKLNSVFGQTEAGDEAVVKV